jgi:hypothetical protein
VVSDLTTKRIAANVNHIINLPLNIQSAYQSLLRLKLDILLIPDWQPFPDAQVRLELLNFMVKINNFINRIRVLPSRDGVESLPLRSVSMSVVEAAHQMRLIIIYCQSNLDKLI